MMTFIKADITKELAVSILNWQYEPPYDFYNNEVTDVAIRELMNGDYKAVLNEQRELIGFYCAGSPAQVFAGLLVGVYDEPYIDVGFGMRPDLTGKGMGADFCTFILKDVLKSNNSKPIRLTVSTFNKRAINLYEKLGFEKHKLFKRDETEFMTMVKK